MAPERSGTLTCCGARGQAAFWAFLSGSTPAEACPTPLPAPRSNLKTPVYANMPDSLRARRPEGHPPHRNRPCLRQRAFKTAKIRAPTRPTLHASAPAHDTPETPDPVHQTDDRLQLSRSALDPRTGPGSWREPAFMADDREDIADRGPGAEGPVPGPATPESDRSAETRPAR